jgi:multidrug efflux system outer membrane protein
MRNSILMPTVSLGLLLAGCAVGPNYKKPITATAPSFAQTGTNQISVSSPEPRWWGLFQDQTLTDLITKAATNNPDLKVAEARLGDARALRRHALWGFAPEGGVSGSFARRQFAAPELAGLNPASRVGNTWAAGFDATWEIDVFGRQRRATEAASAEVGVATAQLRDAQVALLGEVAANYFALQGARETIGVLRQQAELLKKSLVLTRQRVTAGRGTGLDTARAEALLKETEAALPLAQREEQEILHRLSVLLGEQPGSMQVRSAAPTDTGIKQIAIGTPAELLRRRPDVAAAERRLAAATAQVGVRTAEMFPEVSVRGFIRLIGADGVRLGSAASQAWAAAPAASWHVLSLGRLNALRQASQFQAKGALAIYERTVLQAMEDVENALVRYRTADERLTLLVERQRAAEEALRIGLDQYRAGSIGSFEYLDAQRTALAARQETVSAETEHRLAVVAVYKALGGGWEHEQLWAAK